MDSFLSCQVLKSDRGETANSPEYGDIGENSVRPCDRMVGHNSMRKKSSAQSGRSRTKPSQSEGASSNAKNVSESSDSDIGPRQNADSPSKVKLAGKFQRNSKRVAERVLSCMRKRQKKAAVSDSDSVASGGHLAKDMKLRSTSRKENEDASSSSQKNVKSPPSGRSRRKESTTQDINNLLQEVVSNGPPNEVSTDPPAIGSAGMLKKEELIDEKIYKKELRDNKSWRTFEKSLYEKGVEIFGRNRSVDAFSPSFHILFNNS